MTILNIEKSSRLLLKAFLLIYYKFRAKQTFPWEEAKKSAIRALFG